MIRYKDPETGKMLDERVTGHWAKNKDTVTAYAREKSAELQERKRQILGGSTPHRAAMMEIGDAMEVYFRGHDISHKAETIYRASADELVEWCERVGVRTVRQLSKEALREFRDQLKHQPKRVPVKGGRKGEYADSAEPRSPSSVNKALRACSAILNDLRVRGTVRLSRDDIADALKRFKAETERKSILSQRAIHAVLQEQDRFVALKRCLLLTGIRLEEALLIEWRDVEADVLRIRAAVGKGGKKRDVDLTVARTAFGPRGEDEARCFPYTMGEVRTAYEGAEHQWRPHQLRRTWSSYFVAAFGAWRACKSAGHQVTVMEKSYADLVKVPDGCTSLEAAMGV